MGNEALGMVETKGLVGAIEAADDRKRKGWIRAGNSYGTW